MVFHIEFEFETLRLNFEMSILNWSIALTDQLKIRQENRN